MLLPYVWNPLKNILMTFETFLMMSITTERYLAIKNPIEYRLGEVLLVKVMIVWSHFVRLVTNQLICIHQQISYLQWRYSSSIHLAIYILPALLLSIIFNIPKVMIIMMFMLIGWDK